MKPLDAFEQTADWWWLPFDDHRINAEVPYRELARAHRNSNTTWLHRKRQARELFGESAGFIRKSPPRRKAPRTQPAQHVATDTPTVADDEPPPVIPSPLSRWLVEFQDDIRAGRVRIAEIVVLADSDMQRGMPDLCPKCSAWPARPDAHGRAHGDGRCTVCYLRRLRDVHLEKAASLALVHEINQAKKARQRGRDLLGLKARSPEAKVAEDYGRPSIPPADRIIPTGTCTACGRRFPQHALADGICLKCEDKLERRRARRGGDDVTTPDERDVFLDGLTGAQPDKPPVDLTDEFMVALTGTETEKPTDRTDPFLAGLTGSKLETPPTEE